MSKVWLTTGCSRGLGRELAEAALAAGHHLVATARDPGDLAFLSPSDRLHTVALDVTDAAAARAAVDAATSAFRASTSSSTTPATSGPTRRRFTRRGVPPADRHQFVRRLQRDARRVARDARSARRTHHPDLVHWRAARHARPGGYQAAEWSVGGLSEVLAREVAPLAIRVTCVEPGGMRTDMFGLSMLAEHLAPDYEATVGAVIRGNFGRAEGARGGPAKVAQAILRLADEKQPPVHLLLGSDAVSGAAAALAARAEEDARWKALSLSTDYDGGGV